MSRCDGLDGDGEELLNEADYDDQIDGNSCVFNSDKFVSKPVKSEKCRIDENILQLQARTGKLLLYILLVYNTDPVRNPSYVLCHSFGYDCCSKMFNICAADDHTVVYAAGSYINMFDINDGSLKFRKCAGNGGIGHITKNPVFSHLAVGENCNNPLIIVYEWPTFEVISVLRGSTKKQNNWLTYSKNGKYLCSQGGEPDNTLTIWDWKESKIVLRTKSHNQNVDICRFSNFIPDHLVTAGSGHVQFWKMANTFTGLKIQGRMGRFGKTEVSDVVGIFSMPDEKVISGCQWGNILVWDDEIIDLQVMRKGRKPCHLAPIIMFLYSEHDMELTSVSMDGTIKFWYYRTVNTADPPEKDRVLEMEPSFTINVQDSAGVAKIMGMCKVNENPNSFDYFIQDGNGGMWLADIRVAADMKPLRRLAKFHGDVITCLQASPIGYFIATASLDGWFHVYDVTNKKLIFMHDFKVPITSLIWLPLKIASTGNVFVIGFQTGILKIIAVPLTDIIEENSLKLIEIQSSKPHTSSIGHLTVNLSATVLISGSDDSSIFFYEILTEPIKLNPIGMYPLLGKVNFIYWKPSEREQKALVSCSSGHIVEVDVPTSRPAYTKESFLLKLESRTINTVSVESGIDRDPCKADTEKTREKTVKLGTAGENNPSAIMVIDFEDSNEHRGDASKRFVSPSPGPAAVLFAIYTPSEKTLWASIDRGHGAGYLYEYDFETPAGPINATAIPGKSGIPLTAIETIGTDPLTVLMGFADGSVRVMNVNVDDISDLSDYIEYSIHDNRSGKVKKLCFSQDNLMLYTYGDDGNIFSFMFRCNDSDIEKNSIPLSKFPRSNLMADDIIQTEEDLKLSLEERKINKEKRKAINLANQEKDRTSCVLHGLKEKFKLVLNSNKSLPEPLQFSHDYFQLDERINKSLIEEAQSEMDKLHLKLAFDYEKSLLGLKKLKTYFVDPVLTTKFKVKAISKDVEVKTIYHEVRHNLFSSLMEEFTSKKNSRRQRRKSTMLKKSNGNQVHKVTESEIFLRNVREICPSLPKKIQSAIDKFAARIDFENKEILKIKSMHNEKPDNTKVEEEAILDNAWETIGNFNLKTASDFKPSSDKIISIDDKFQQYIHVRDEIFNLKSTFNEKVFDLKQRKIKLIHDYKQFKFDISEIQNELESPDVITPLDFPELVVDEFIDSDLIDLFKPICDLGPMCLMLNSKKSDFYPKIYKNEFDENATHLELIMQKMEKEKLKHKHDCLHESMLTKINIFDDHLSMLETTRKNVKLRITFLELFALTLEEELLVLNDFDLVEDEYSYNVYLITVKQNDKINQIQKIREDIKYYNKIIENKLNRLIDVQHTFDMEVRNDDFAKHLRKIFKKKLRIAKVKSDDEDNDESLSSSSDESEFDSDSESVENGSVESLTTMGRLAVFDENVLPEGCDEKLFALTFELRSQRHEIEQSIEKTKIKAELSNKSLCVAEAELIIIENEYKKSIDELEAYQIEKQLKLNDVETTIVLNKSQAAKSRLLKNSILVYGNVMQVLTNRVTELKKEIDDIKDTYKDEKLLAKQLRTEINAMEHVLKKIKVAIRDEMIKKFRMETDWSFLDDMEMAIINCMIIQAKSNAEETKQRFVKEVKLLENQIRAHQEMLTDLLGSNTVKTITLKGVREGIQQLQQCLSIQQKNNEKVQDLSVDSSYTSDMSTLKDVFNTLLKRKQDICKEIDTLKYKGKMFPPIAKQPSCASANAKPDHSPSIDRVPRLFSATPSSAQDETEDSWTIDHGDEEEVYNMEFNVEPKVSASSKQSSSRLTKQSSHYDGFENIDEACSYGENQWTRYYADDDDEDGRSGVIMTAAVEDFARDDVFAELQVKTEVGRNDPSDDEGSTGGDVESNNRKQWTKRANDNDFENGPRKSL